METASSLGSEFAYLQQLVGAGWDGIAAARHELAGKLFTPPLHGVAWTPTAVGATIGVLSTRLTGKPKSASNAAVGGLIGSAVGFGAALVWASRRFTGTAARKAVRQVNATRDAHWLEANPIDYA